MPLALFCISVTAQLWWWWQMFGDVRISATQLLCNQDFRFKLLFNSQNLQKPRLYWWCQNLNCHKPLNTQCWSPAFMASIPDLNYVKWHKIWTLLSLGGWAVVRLLADLNHTMGDTGDVPSVHYQELKPQVKMKP